MPKAVAAEALPGPPGPGTAAARKRVKRASSTATGTRGSFRSAEAKQIDPKVRVAIQKGGSEPLVVMLKFDSKGSNFGRLPVTNRAGSARERAFNQEVAAEVLKTSSDGNVKILSLASNLGVATVQATAGVVRGLMASSKIAGMKLKR